MTPETFIAKWQANTRNERAACHEHFIDLCALLDEPTPNTDPTGARYAFEKGVTKAAGGDGWADAWRAERFASSPATRRNPPPHPIRRAS